MRFDSGKLCESQKEKVTRRWVKGRTGRRWNASPYPLTSWFNHSVRCGIVFVGNSEQIRESSEPVDQIETVRCGDSYLSWAFVPELSFCTWVKLLYLSWAFVPELSFSVPVLNFLVPDSDLCDKRYMSTPDHMIPTLNMPVTVTDQRMMSE